MAYGAGGERSYVKVLRERVNLGCGCWDGGKKRDECILLRGISVFLELANVTDSVWQIRVQSRDQQA